MRRRIRDHSSRLYESNTHDIQDLSIPDSFVSPVVQAVIAVLRAVEGQGRFLERLYISAQKVENDCIEVQIQRPWPVDAGDASEAFPADFTVCGEQIVKSSAPYPWCADAPHTQENIAEDRALCRAAVAACSVLWKRHPEPVPMPFKWTLLTIKEAGLKEYFVFVSPGRGIKIGMRWVIRVSFDFKVAAAGFSNR